MISFKTYQNNTRDWCELLQNYDEARNKIIIHHDDYDYERLFCSGFIVVLQQPSHQFVK